MFMVRNNRHQKALFAVVLISVFGGVYGLRIWYAKTNQPCATLCKYDDNTSELNRSHFDKFVAPNIKGESRFNLIIFLDPARECSVCLYETEYWLAPLGATPEFMVHFFFPLGTDQEKLQNYLNALDLSAKNINYFNPTSDLNDYISNGLVKIFFDREMGIRWYEFGNSSEADQLNFLKMLNGTLAHGATPRK